MINHHRIARDAERDVSRRESVARATEAQLARIRQQDRDNATEQWPPVTPEQKRAVLDLYSQGLTAARADVVIRERYGVRIDRFLQVVNQIRKDMTVFPDRALECNRLARLTSKRRELRERAAAMRATGGAA
ncbi:hypothetical protein UA75_30870 (plasmid) [Actinoalloteichus sp. GBA129-24]|nr:hypothetical protein UA75_14390 [Actinoalloteichus sp. GBA129-24]APU24137.1 hypothetical protein UA75_30870 [Actinoalloteichus sp. GBA129-24]